MLHVTSRALTFLVISSVAVCSTVYAAPRDCPTWTLPDSSSNKSQGGCKCGNSVGDLVKCDSDDLNVSLLMDHCMTFDKEAGMAYLASCPFRLKGRYNMYNPLPRNVSELNDFVCSPYNRHGLVCSQCNSGYGPSVYTNNLQCYQCSVPYSGWLLYIVFELFPITVLFGVMSFLHIRLTSSAANCLLFNMQMIVAILSYGEHIGVFPFGTTSEILHKTLLSVYGILNLDFFRDVVPPFCVDENINGLHSIALQYVAVVYLLALTLSVFLILELHYRGSPVTMFLWKNLFMRLIRVKQNWTCRTSLADSLATCLLLSYTRLMLISFNLLYPVSVINEYGEVAKKTLNFQQDIGYLSEQHIPYALLGLTVLIALLVLPFTLFVVYPMKCCQNCVQYAGNRPGIRHFVELFQRCFKDGTDGTRDYRSFAIFYFALRFAMFVSHIVGYGGRPRISFLLPGVMLMAASLTILTFRPYKKEVYNVVDGVMLACAAVLCFFQSVMVIIPNTPAGKLLQIAIQIGFFLPLFGTVFYCVYLCIVWCRRQGLSHKRSDSCESLPHRLLHPDDDCYTTKDPPPVSPSDTKTSHYGTISYNTEWSNP